MAYNSVNGNGLIEDRIFGLFLKSKELLYTYERQIILKGITKITKTDSHFSFDSIYNHLVEKRNRVSKSTIYKTLKLLESCNLIKRIDIKSESYVYEKTNRHNIGHLVCLECGKIIPQENMS
ncbi:MAG: Fur family transcriptional regulator [Candidatus Anammoxibacter sp.]